MGVGPLSSNRDVILGVRYQQDADLEITFLIANL